MPLKGVGSLPKDTFYNLNDDKKRKIFDAAVQEFSTRRFSEASINKIVKAAGIPRGSFYQYFSGKEDLFEYIFKEILKEKFSIIRKAAIFNPEADVFETCMHTIRATFEWSKLKPEYNQIGMLMEIDNSEFIAKLRAISFEGLRNLIERDKERGLIKSGIDSDLVIEMIYGLIWKQFSLIGFDKDMFLKRINDGMAIIKSGIAIAAPK
jgi:AcrR family transcriptional regulator